VPSLALLYVLSQRHALDGGSASGAPGSHGR
jgi:hypothetical protein